MTSRIALGRIRLRLRNPGFWRLASGLVLFSFVLTHFLNHALGLVSFEAMQTAQLWRTAITRSLPGNALLLAAAGLHVAFGLWKILQISTHRIGLRNLAQMGFALLAPLWLIRHVIAMRQVTPVAGIAGDYSYALGALWPGGALNIAILMALIWTHGCIGLYHWLGGRAWFRQTLVIWQFLAVAVPLLSYAGFATAGRIFAATLGTAESPLTPDQAATLYLQAERAERLYLTLLALLVVVWLAMRLADRLGSRVKVTYLGGRSVQAPRGLPLLAISRINQIPHAAVCGGRARCSTCRVRVVQGAEGLAPPNAAEQAVLRRIGAPAHVRLACQMVVQRDITVSTLLPAGEEGPPPETEDRLSWGVERDLTVMFIDLRGFTKLSETRLPYDTVFLLNRFLGHMADAIEDSGGYVDKFMGDGIMAIFGIGKSSAEGAREAVMAARAMAGVLDALNLSLKEDLPAPLAMGIGLHCGPAILGRIGASRQTDQSPVRLTALGNTVNLASRLEGKAKELGVQLVISAECMERAGIPTLGCCSPDLVTLRGLSQPVPVFVFQRTSDLPEPVMDMAG